LAFLDRQRPWERAEVIVDGTPQVDLEPDHVQIAPALRTPPR
jgi:hypothetical protein